MTNQSKMNPELKARWIEALEGEYADRKGEKLLHRVSDGTMCCLGVLCDIQGVEWSEDKVESGGYLNSDLWTGTTSVEQDIAWGLSGVHTSILISLNDISPTFAPVIEYIRENL